MKNIGAYQRSVYKKSLDLKDLGTAVAHYFSIDRSPIKNHPKSGLRNDIARAIFIDASLLPSKVARISASAPKEVSFKHLRFIQTMTKNLWSYCNGLEHDGVEETEYIQLLKKEVNIFQDDFKRWKNALINFKN